MNKITKTTGLSLSTLLFLLFLTLKLCKIGEVAEWSWIWVCSPLWIPFSGFGLLLIFAVIVSIIRPAKNNSETGNKSRFQEKLEERMNEERK